MTVDSQSPAESAPRWGRMPGAVRLELDREIIRHRREHGSRHYELLREDRRFAPWIGLHRGDAGEKRLDRYIAELRQNQPRKMGGEAKALANPSATTELSCPGQGLANPGGAASFLDGGAAVMSYAELQAGFRATRIWLEQAMMACENELGEIAKPEEALRFSRELRAVLRDSAALTRSFHADLNSEAFMGRVIERVEAEHPDDPDKARELQADIHQIFADCGGLAAIGGVR